MSDLREVEANKVLREAHFPLSLIEHALRLGFRESHAAQEQDKRKILDALHHQQQPDALEADPIVLANEALRGRLAVAALRPALDASPSLFTRCLSAARTSALASVTVCTHRLAAPPRRAASPRARRPWVDDCG